MCKAAVNKETRRTKAVISLVSRLCGIWVDLQAVFGLASGQTLLYQFILADERSAVAIRLSDTLFKKPFV